MAVARSSLWGVSGVTLGYIVRLPQFALLGQKRRDHHVAVHDLPQDLGVEALLGLDFFRNTRFCMDFRLGQLELE